MKITLLGTGSTYRTPTIGGFWGKCDPNNIKNQRLCQSALIETNGKRLLIDIGPDIRQQTLSYKIDNIDAVLLTHAHYDHCFGLPELKVFSFVHQKVIPVYAHNDTWDLVASSFHWFLDKENTCIDRRNFEFGEEFYIHGYNILPFEQKHGEMNSTGFRIGSFAYTTDVESFPAESWKHIDSVRTWVLDCDGIEPSESHNNLKQALEWINRIQPERAYLTHIHPFVDHDHLQSLLPKGVEVAYDGQIIEVPD